MTTVDEFVEFIDKLENPIVSYWQEQNWPINGRFNKFDIRIFTKDVRNFNSLEDWIKKKNLTKYIQKNIILTILSLDPPENIKNELICIELKN